MVYESLNGTLVSGDLSQLLIYSNTVTSGWFGLFTLISFFIIVFISSMMFQIRTSREVKPSQTLLVTSFATIGFATLFEQVTGILSALHFAFLIGVFLLSLVWTLLSND